MRPEPRPAAHKVVVFVVDGIYPIELGIPHHVLGTAGGRYEVVTAGVDGKPVRTVSDLTVTPGTALRCWPASIAADGRNRHRAHPRLGIAAA